MNTGKTIFKQLVDFLPLYEIQCCVRCYKGNYNVISFSCYDQFLCMAFSQITYRENLRDIEACLRFQQPKLYHMGIRGSVPVFIKITDGKVHDVNILDDLIPKAGSFYLMDHGYLDFARLDKLN
jgi:hypothetical protein